VAEVNIAGNQHLPTEELLTHVAVSKARLFFSRGKFSERLARGSAENLKRVYQAEGFSDVKVTPRVTTRGGNLVVTFQIVEGEQDIVGALRIEGNDTVPVSQLAPKGLQVSEGQPYSQKRVDDDRSQIMSQYLNRGYLNSTFREVVNPIDGEKNRLEVVYQITEGPRVEIAKVVTLGRKQTRQTLVDRTAQIRSGQPMRQGDMLTSESELYTLGIFDWTQVNPRRQITTQTKEDALLKVHESKRNTITYGVGFEVTNRGGSVPSGTIALPGLPPVGLPSRFRTSEKTFLGPRGSFEYTRKNVRGKAETITIGGLAARLDQRASFAYVNPHFRGTNWASNLTVTGEHNSTNPIFTSRLAEYGIQLQRALNQDKTQNVFLRYSVRQTGLTRLLLPELIPPEDLHVRLSTVSGTYIRDTRDNVLDAHKGIYDTFEIDLNPAALGSNVSFARLRAQAAYYRRIVGGVIWANSLRLGVAKPFSDSHVPLSEKFFSGGGSTLRGFPLNGAGPQRTIPACGDPADPSSCSFIRVPVGGNQLAIVNSEFRIPVPITKGLGVAAFYDGGNVFERIGFHGQYTNTIGVGLRYVTPVGPVRIDLGHNLNAIPGIKSTQIFVTLGQAF
jgi:outer membrane protein assembly factor BamA